MILDFFRALVFALVSFYLTGQATRALNLFGMKAVSEEFASKLEELSRGKITPEELKDFAFREAAPRALPALAVGVLVFLLAI